MKFEKGDLVRLKSDPSKMGSIISSIDSADAIQYSILLDNKVQSVFEQQLEPYQIQDKTRILSKAEFDALLTAIQILHPSSHDLYSLGSAKISFIPHQYKPVLKIIRADQPRILIADSVGVGKTIEAGLIIKELQARQQINNIAIICPRPLVAEKKWQQEMLRFDEKFIHMDGHQLRLALNECDLEGEWPDDYAKCIIPYSILQDQEMVGVDESKSKSNRAISKKTLGLINLNPPPHFDIVIVDEAHHIRNRKNAYQAVKFFCDNADAVILLTATPIQLRDNDLFVLLNLIRPDLVIDKTIFDAMTEPNRFINCAISNVRQKGDNWQSQALQCIANAQNTQWVCHQFVSNQGLISAAKLLQNSPVDDTQRIEIIQLLEDSHTFANLINRTRRRDIDKYCVRKPDTILIEFTPQQRELHDQLLKVQSKILAHVYDPKIIKFLISTLLRQASSCIFALAPHIKDILSRHVDELLSQEDDNIEWKSNEIEKSINDIHQEIQQVVQLAQQLPNQDNKLEALCKIIQDKQQYDNNKIMVFSTFRYTLSYLFEKLRSLGLRVGLIHGGVVDEDRVALRQRFERDKTDTLALDIMLFSEVGCEGLDYQFCDCMVNYDLPWNPMKIEQRIGRIDRNGQKSSTVLIYNIITKDTVDADIYDRCLRRIGVFEEAIGGNEQILGDITNKIADIAQKFELSSSERQELLQQLADNQIRIINQTQKVEESEYDLLTLQIPKNNIKQAIDNATNHWLSSPMIINLIKCYFLSRLHKSSDCILGSQEQKTLRLSADNKKLLLDDLISLPKNKNKANKEWQDYLKSDQTNLSICFDGQFASNNNIHFISLLHPLARQATRHISQIQTGKIALKATTTIVPSGNYPFAVYQWEVSGTKTFAQLQVIAKDKIMEDHLLDLIQVSTQIEIDPIQSEQLSDQHYALWQIQRLKHIEQTNANIDKQLHSLQVSTQARCNLALQQKQASTNEKIKRLKDGEIKNIDRDYQRKQEELNNKKQKADILTTFIASGILIVEN